jgi:hypothetical protein
LSQTRNCTSEDEEKKCEGAAAGYIYQREEKKVLYPKGPSSLA